MATATELIVAEELDQLRQIAEHEQGWIMTILAPEEFLFGLPRKGGGELWVHCQVDQYPTLPPSWRWCGPEGEMIDDPRVTPVEGSTFFHGAGVLCAPWNRIAYKNEDPRGPHNDWIIGDWKSNPQTRECKTLAAMVIRIAVESRLRFIRMKQTEL